MEDTGQTYDKLILLNEFNVEPQEESICKFSIHCNSKNRIKQNTCFKNPDKTTGTDLLLTNCPRSFIDTDTCETELSDFHRLTFNVSDFRKPKVVIHRQYRQFS